VVGFLSTAGAVHFVQQRTNVASGSWTTVETNIAGTGGILRVTNAVPAGTARQFYRVGTAGP